MEIGRRLSPAHLQTLQERVHRDIPERFRFPRLLAVLALHEEVGELLSAIERRTGDGAADVVSEIGDVFLSCIELANAYAMVLRPPPEPSATAHETRPTLDLALAAARVSSECLEVEGFDAERKSHLNQALDAVLAALVVLAASLGLDPVAALESKVARILALIADGSWDRRYADRLQRKRAKLD
jgi:NTP pyrophosphatase (non-canonical NTP hydrolase)